MFILQLGEDTGSVTIEMFILNTSKYNIGDCTLVSVTYSKGNFI